MEKSWGVLDEMKRETKKVRPCDLNHAGESWSMYRYAPHNDVSVSDGPYIWRWSHKVIPLCFNYLQFSVQ
jgi:hypothetical protein